KTDGKTTAVPGTSDTYTITVSNSGPSTATSVAVSDKLPAALTGATWTGTNGSSGSGNVSDTIASLAPRASVTYTLHATIHPGATGSLLNTATASAANDTSGANNSATDTDSLTPQNDVSITKTDGKTTAVPGTSDTYTITVSNSGPSAAASVSVNDPVPAALTGASWTGSDGSTGSGNITDTIASLAPNASVTYVLS